MFSKTAHYNDNISNPSKGEKWSPAGFMGCHGSGGFRRHETKRWNCCIRRDSAFDTQPDTQLSPGRDELIANTPGSHAQ